jgi:hypothetical protein
MARRPIVRDTRLEVVVASSRGLFEFAPTRLRLVLRAQEPWAASGFRARRPDSRV